LFRGEANTILPLLPASSVAQTTFTVRQWTALQPRHITFPCCRHRSSSRMSLPSRCRPRSLYRISARLAIAGSTRSRHGKPVQRGESRGLSGGDALPTLAFSAEVPVRADAASRAVVLYHIYICLIQADGGPPSFWHVPSFRRRLIAVDGRSQSLADLYGRVASLHAPKSATEFHWFDLRFQSRE